MLAWYTEDYRAFLNECVDKEEEIRQLFESKKEVPNREILRLLKELSEKQVVFAEYMKTMSGVID